MKRRRKLAEAEAAVIAAARALYPLMVSPLTGPTHERIAIRERFKDAVEALDALDVPDPAADHGRWVEGAPETSQHAALIAPRGIRREIIMQIASTPDVQRGLTDEELERRLKARHTTVSAARNHLMNVGWLADGGWRRNGTSRRPTVVWEITPAGWRAIKEGVFDGAST